MQNLKDFLEKHLFIRFISREETQQKTLNCPTSPNGAHYQPKILSLQGKKTMVMEKERYVKEWLAKGSLLFKQPRKDDEDVRAPDGEI